MIRTVVAAAALFAAGVALVAPQEVNRAAADYLGIGSAPTTGRPAPASTPSSRSSNVPSAPAPAPAATAPVDTGGAYDSRGSRGGADSYAFLSDATWDRCTPIRIRFNPQGAPSGAVADLRTAARKVAQASGLRIDLARTTRDDRLYRYDTVAGASGTVLVTWGTAGDGILDAGASATTEPHLSADGRSYESGQVTINVANDHLYAPGFGAAGSRVALYMHELGHLVGLDHVEDPRQLMFGSVAGLRDFGAGDLNGLAQVAAGPCR